MARSILMMQRQIGKISLFNSGKLGNFLVLAPFCYPSLQNNGCSYPYKNYFSEQLKTEKVCFFSFENCSFWKHL